MHCGMKRSYRVLAQAACLFTFIATFWLWSGRVPRDESIVRPVLPPQWKTAPEGITGQGRLAGSKSGSNAPADALVPGNGNSATQGSSASPTNPSGVNHKPISNDAIVDIPHAQLNPMYAPYVKAILDPDDTTLPRLECPAINETRYAHLRSAHPDATAVDPRAPLKYLFALNLRQAKGVLPRLLGSVLQVARFLGPTACMLSIVEGHSDDGTAAILAALKPELARLGLRYRLRSSALDPATGDRIQRLAGLRNAALAPILPPSATSPDDDDDDHDAGNANVRATADAATTVLFLNDVAACADDVLELAHQRAVQAAAMTCALDWTYVGRDPTFYDVWVTRALSGGPFFDIPADGNWDSAWNLLPGPRDGDARRRLAAARPFQVYACWNGAVAFTAAPLLGLPPPQEQASVAAAGAGTRVAFRASRDGECFMGEPTLFCKDLWWAGYGRIAVVPSVNLEYSDEAARKIKLLKGYTSDWTAKEDAEANKIIWDPNPPEQVKCMPSWDDQSWRPWNESLA